MIQRPLLPVELQNLLPPPPKAVHCDGIGVDAKGQRYAVKFATRYPALPANEAFCHELAHSIGLRTPAWAPVQHHLDHRIGFGSCWLPDCIEPESARIASYWNSQEPSQQEAFFTLCCVIDGFLFNPDRHFGNFLLTGASRMATIPHGSDYSCAWWMAQWGDENVLGHCISKLIYVALRSKRAFKPAVALKAIESLRQLGAPQISQWFSRWPDEWNRAGQLEDTVDWWDSPYRLHRLNRMESQIQHGQLPL